MASDRYRSLSPEAIVATLRSLSRRYRAELANDPSIDLDAVARGGEGPSPAAIITTASNGVSALADAIHKAAVLDEPSLTIAAATPGDGGSIDAALAALDAATAHAAQVVDDLPTEAWARKARVSGSGLSGEMTVLELAQESAREGVERLRELTALLDKLKRDR
ncbi:MAG TPA: hypothetical protein VM282_19685 [Acidimicrobiales bacterium]|nr:hypothetical protein [Acidimicrobiales bacterium]